MSLSVQESDSNYYNVDTYSGTNSFTTTAGSISATVTPALMESYMDTTYTFAFTPQHGIPQKAYIEITYPSQISIADSSYSASQCSSWSNFPSTPTCSISTADRKITLTKGFKNNAGSAGTTYSFGVPGMTNPISQDPTDTFVFYVRAESAYLVDQSSDTIFVQMTETSAIKSASVSLSTFTNAAEATYTFQIVATVPVSQSDKLYITFPAEITLPDDDSSFTCASGDTSLIDSVTCEFYGSTKDTVWFEFDLNGIAQIDTLETFNFYISPITNPESTKATSSFDIKIRDTNFNQINAYTGSLTVSTSTPAQMTTASLAQSDTGAAALSRYTLTFTPLHDIEAGGGILIVYPSQITIPEADDFEVYSVSHSNREDWVLYEDSRQISITNAFRNAFEADGEEVTVIIDGFKNPVFAEQTDSFIIKTLTTDSYQIDAIDSGLVLNNYCDYPCLTCKDEDPSDCLSCFSTGLNKLQGGTCVSECATGKFHNTGTGACEDCDSSCLDCEGSTTTCTACGLGDLLFLHSGSCQSMCPDTYFADT